MHTDREGESFDLGQKSAFVTGNICSGCRLPLFWPLDPKDIDMVHSKVVGYKWHLEFKESFSYLLCEGGNKTYCEPSTFGFEMTPPPWTF